MEDSASTLQLKRDRGAHVSELNRICKDIENHLLSYTNKDLVSKAVSDLDNRFNSLQDAHDALLASVKDTPHSDEFEVEFESIKKNYDELKTRVQEWFASEPQEDDDKKTVSSTTSASSRAKLRRQKLKRAMEELKLKEIQQMEELEHARVKLDFKKQTVKQLTSVRQAQIEEEMLLEEINDENGKMNSAQNGNEQVTENAHNNVSSVSAPSNSRTNAPSSNDVATDSHTRPTIPPTPQENAPATVGQGYPATVPTVNSDEHRSVVSGHENTPAGCQQQFLEQLTITMRDGFSLPKPEPLKFNGNPLDYCTFIHNFDATIGKTGADGDQKLNYLRDHCEKEVSECFTECILIGGDRGYQKAREILYDYYGRPNLVAESYVKRIVNGPDLRNDDVEGLVKLSKDMVRCEITLKEMGYFSEINNSVNLRSIVKRLPSFIRAKWVDKADFITESGREPNFTDLAEFIKVKARASRSMYGMDLATENKGNSYQRKMSKVNSKKSYSEKRATTLATQGEHDTSRVRKCWCCKGTCSDLSACSKFKGMCIDDRRSTLRKFRLCDNCFGYKHIAARCKKPKACSVPECGEKHHTLLHSWGNKDSAMSNTNCIGTVTCEERKVSMNVVPVYIEGTCGKGVETYAFIDNGSDISLCDRRLLQKLGICGKQRSYTITTLNQTSVTQNGRETSLTVKSLDRSNSVTIPRVWSVSKLPVVANNIPTSGDLERFSHLRDLDIPRIDSKEVMLLIGSDVPDVTCPLEVRRGQTGEPCALLSPLGWSVVGPLCGSNVSQGSVNFQQSTDIELYHQVERMWKADFSDKVSDMHPMSVEDRQAFSLMESTLGLEDGHYQLGLPWRSTCKQLPNNKAIASVRLNLLKKKLLKDDDLKERYVDTIKGYIENGHAEKVANRDEEGERTWYLPHHPVQNPKKPGKVRVVFDCAAKYRGTSLNDQLLQGPDLMNDLVGVLIRFRQDKVALAADIESMFHQVKVSERDRDSLRFLWWDNGDMSKDPSVYRMKVHIFGATSSPSCAAYALKRAGRDQSSEFGEQVVSTIEKNFYVDDLFKSVDSESQAIELARDLRQILSNRGFRLTKWLSNRIGVLESIPDQDRSPSIVNLDKTDDLPRDRALGVQWDIGKDVLCFDVSLKEKPVTRRGILSVISSLFDPLGLVSPVTLQAKFILQTLCRYQLGWDDPIPEVEAGKWKDWLGSLPMLKNVHIDRCYKSSDFGSVATAELHVFSDACQYGYGACIYLRLTDTTGRVTCSLVQGKSRLAPIKQITIPRLELQAAVIGCRLSRMVKSELEIKIDRTVFWTDSMIVLGYINNQSKRFKVFVSNRLSTIHECSEPNQWRHVRSELNPADLASRGMSSGDLVRIRMWLDGPKFLLLDEHQWPVVHSINFELSDEDVEVKRETTVCSIVTSPKVSDLFSRYSAWDALQRSVAWLNRFKIYCIHKYLKHREVRLEIGDLSVDELENARNVVIKVVQNEYFCEELKALERGGEVSNQSSLVKLCPVLIDGLIRVGGRLQGSSLSFKTCHPILVPAKSHVTNLIIRDAHEVCGHVGVNHVLAKVRNRYWIVRGTSAVKSVISKCFKCRKSRQPPLAQQMATLPKERLTPDKPPFTYVGVDFFGPLLVKVGRGTQKRYGCIFTCLTVRAVHIEIAHSLDTSSFISAVRRFVSRRGAPEKIFSDNGTNMVAGERELRESILKWNLRHIKGKLHQNQIQWHFNPPHASHMGGVWERMIRSVKSVLKALVGEQLLNDESLLSLMCEAEKIVNDRPITQVSSDPRDLEPLTPNTLLTLKSSNPLPPGIFMKSDVYAKRWWRQVLYLAGIFWKRWIREYLPTLQVREKWQRPHRSVRPGDIVLLVEENTPRGQWPLGRVLAVTVGRDGLVRSCNVRTSTSQVVRPIAKLCLLEASD